MRVRFTLEAHLAAREKRAWWERNREKAPQLFVEELAEVVAKLRHGADHERRQYAARGGRIIYRLLSFARGVGPSGPTVAANVRCLEGVDLDTVPTQKFDGKSR